MATGVGFEGSNGLLYGYDEVRDLEVFRDDSPQTISCWRLSKEELEEVNRTGVVWLSVVGHRIPPVLVSGVALVECDGIPSKAEPIIPMKPIAERKNDAT